MESCKGIVPALRHPEILFRFHIINFCYLFSVVELWLSRPVALGQRADPLQCGLTNRFRTKFSHSFIGGEVADQVAIDINLADCDFEFRCLPQKIRPILFFASQRVDLIDLLISQPDQQTAGEFFRTCHAHVVSRIAHIYQTIAYIWYLRQLILTHSLNCEKLQIMKHILRRSWIIKAGAAC